MEDELYLEYMKDLKEVENAPDDVFPDFLFTLQTNDFDEDYYALGRAESPLLQEAKLIRRKYSDYFDYQDALEVYTTYMELLADKYGYMNVKAVAKAAKNGMFEDYIPPKPRLKNSRKNRNLAMAGMMPSRKVGESASSEEMINIARQMMPFANGTIDDLDIRTKPTKEIRKIFESASDRIGGMQRRRNMYRNSGTNAEIDFILNHINNGGSYGGYRTGGIYGDDYDNRPLSAIVKDMKEEELIPEPLLEEYLAPNTRFIRNGQIHSSKREKDVEIMALLYESGLDVFGTYGKNMSKEAVKMVRHAVGASGPMTKKERKQMKKMRKEENQRLATKRQNDQMLERTLLRNRYTFDREDGTMSFTLSDLFDR